MNDLICELNTCGCHIDVGDELVGALLCYADDLSCLSDRATGIHN